MSLAKEVFIVAAKRTAFGTFGGTLKSWTATQLATEAAKAAVSVLPSASIIDSVCVGNVSQTSADTPYLARHVGLGAGVPIEVPMLTVNRLCGSGFQSIITGAQEICLGESSVVLSGGSESMSSAPFAVRDCRWGTTLGKDMALKDTLWEVLTDSYIGCPMAITAENLAEQYGLGKEECDAFAARSQDLWAAANAAGRFANEIVPLEIKTRKGVTVFDTDEHPRAGTTAASLAKLKPLFKKEGTVSAGNASGICDGAGALIIASKEAAETHSLEPLARIVSYAVVGVDPNVMGIGPAPAIRAALTKAGLTLADMDLIEINEAFAPQALACAKDLNLDMDKLNTNGGAIALGHPTGASGSRIIGHLAYELQRTGGRYGVGSACIGGGQGVAIIVERC
eukprot:m.96202 g.96202  ORF g.96202 m.96202 type:complete len:396 (-) comp26875_c0_seq2:143-1330(-)